MVGTLRILDEAKAEGKVKQAQREQAAPAAETIRDVGVSGEKCSLCLNLFGTAIDGAVVEKNEFPNDAARDAFTWKYNLPKDSAVCASCAGEENGYDAVEWVLANVRAIPKEELFAYVTQKDITKQLAKTKEGLEALAGAWNGWRNALYEAVFDEEVALDAVSTEAGRRLLSETRDGRGECALGYAVFSHEDVAVAMIRAEEGFKLLSAAKDLGNPDRSALFVAVRMHGKAALELVRMPRGMAMLASVRDDTALGWTALHEAVGWHQEAMLEAMNTEEGMRLLLEARDREGVSAFYEGARFHEKVLLEILKAENGLELLAGETDKKGESILHGIVSEYLRNTNCSYLYKTAAPAILAAARKRGLFA